jgi:transcriptional regulator with XRE-family HTH domain
MTRRIRENLQAFDTSKEAYAKRMIQLREGFGLSQKEMAAEIGITPGALNKIEKGKQRLSHDHTFVVWQKFGIPVLWLLGGFAGELSDDMRRRLRQGPPPSSEDPSD